MRNTKIVPLALTLSFTVVLLLLGWHHDGPISPTFGSIRLKSAESGSSVKSSNIHELSRESFDYNYMGYKKWVYTNISYVAATDGSVLVASSIANENSFGKGRTFQDFYNVIDSISYPKGSMSLALYCGSPALLEIVQAFFSNTTRTEISFSRVIVLYAPFLQSTFKSSEHTPSVQRLRRRSIARGRNFVIYNALEGEQYTFFLDADIIKLDQADMLKRFVASGKDIVVPRVTRGGSPDYDRNSWRGHRIVPSAEQLDLMDKEAWDEANFEPNDVRGKMYHLGSQVDEIKNLPETDPRRDLGYTVDLDSVGGAVLFVKSIIFKQGIVFPTMNVVGTSWLRKEGYDGIETEGLCYLAQTLGYTCHAMPNLIAQHYDF